MLLRALRPVVLAAGSVVCRSYPLKRGYDSFNPGLGDTRFAPITGTSDRPVATLYGGSDDTGVLLETVFHDVHHHVADRVVYEAVVRTWGLAYVRLPVELTLVDLRDEALGRVGLTRSALVSTTAAHYPCTRMWAAWLHGGRIGGRSGGVEPQGLLWRSRQAELHRPDEPHDVFMLFGDRVPSGRGSYPLAGPGVRNLVEGPGRILLERLAGDLGARIEPADD